MNSRNLPLVVLLFTFSFCGFRAFSQRVCINSEPVVNAGVIDINENGAALPDVIIIPVVVHVVFHTDNENISNEQVKSQLAVLNKDFRKKNADAATIPPAFRQLAADSRFEFRLATTDPSGLPTTGILRKYTSQPGFAANDLVKFSSSGGSDAWNSNDYLNIWVCNLSGGVMGYASTPGSDQLKDGVVIRYTAFGTTANVAAPFNKGRTTVHEIGHWLGLRHIWGDTDCGDDKIEDTPPQKGPTRGCPSGVVSTCTGAAAGSMYMNFMDFTNDECTNMFTQGQANRMRELFVQGGPRMALLSSEKAEGPAMEEQQSDFERMAGMQISPNPAIHSIRIKIPSVVAGVVAKIYNQFGQVVKTVLLNSDVADVAITDLKAGMYYVSTGSGRTLKFVKK